jgi:acylphosphatase
MASREDAPRTAPEAGPARLHAFLSGHVQGVGMRWTIQELAEQSGLTGCVRNLPDGRVELVAEGARERIEEFLSGLRSQMSHYIRNIEMSWAPATGEWQDFRITRW